ncbi:MAG: hypothetical protein WC551_02385 [Patescibacteria group bacterium]
MTPKEIVVGRIISTMADCLDPSTALVATLGGRGLEAKVWRRMGIKPTNGWLVDRSADRIRGLMRNSQGYRLLQGNLTQFPQIFLSSHGLKTGLDFFHWDLCGTVEPAIEEICGVLPLLAQGRGRSLGVTVSDMRQNRAVQSFIFTQDICRLFFGKDWDGLCQTLEEIYRQESVYRIFEIEKAVLREAGTLMYLVLAFATVGRDGHRFRTTNGLHPLSAFLELWRRNAGLEEFAQLFSEVWFAAVPGRIERYSYASGINGFRMRTYSFRIDLPSDWIPLKSVAKRLAAMVRKAPSYVVEGDDCRLIWPMPRPKVKAASAQRPPEQAEDLKTQGGSETIMKTIEEIKKEFEPVLRLPLPGIQEGFEALCRMAERGVQAQAKIDAANKLLAQAAASLNGGTVESVPVHTVEEVFPPATSVHLAPAEVKRQAEVLVMDKIRLEFLYVFAHGGKEALDKKMKEVAKVLGIKKYQHKLGACWARSQGGFRGEFVSRVLTADLLKIGPLAELYGVEASVLQKEARDKGYKGSF